jgi:hypothetical protein
VVQDNGVPEVNKPKTFDAKDRATTRTLLPLVALGGGLAAGPAAALELGDLTVQSHLGQPLRASIAYALAPNEMLSDTCVSVSAGQSTGGLPGIGRNSVSITERAIVISGTTAVREPMLGTRVTVNCPYTPNLSREYMLFVDPATVAMARAETTPAAQPEAAPAVRPALQATAQAPARRRTPVDTTPIDQSTRYQVQPGDTLGDIVRRIENRSMGLWPAVNRVFEANPEAFIDNDPNKLKAGAWLAIPSFDGSAPVVASPAVTVAAAEPATRTTTTGPSIELVPERESPVTAEAPAESAVDDAIAAYDPATTEAPVVADGTADLRPGDIVLDKGPGETIAIPDTELEGPQTASSSPNVPTAIVSTGSRSESTSLLAWLIGGGLAIIAALILFGRRMRGGLSSTPVGPVAEKPQRRATDQAIADAEYDIDDDSPTDENLVLDADLITGSGFEQGTDVDVNQDFGFAATTDLDIELPFEPEAPVRDDGTDVFPAVRDSVESILESEILPEDDDYDMSVIVDATKMPQPEDVTERDLQAIEVNPDDESLATDSYTINQEADFDILEQDYEDELTATQALNQEIERAAAELADDLNEKTVEMPSDGDTSEMPLATVTELDSTAELPTTDDEKTAEFEASYDPNDTNAVTVNMSGEDKTAEMPVANDDETSEMEVSGGTVDTKRLG